MSAKSTLSTIENLTNILSCRSVPDQHAAVTPNDWDTMAITAIMVGLAPLLQWQLVDQLQMASLPPMAVAKLAIIRQAHDERNQAIAGQLTEILAECAQQNIPVIVLKGALLAPLAYPDPALRPMNDIDLLFKPRDIPAVNRILVGLGYQGKYKDSDHGAGITKHLSTYRRVTGEAATPNPYLSTGGDRMVEPHVSLEESWFGLKVDITPGVWDRAMPICLHGQPALRQSATDMLLHLTVHASFHVIMGAAIFLQLYDLGRVIETWPTELDSAQFLSLCRAAGAQPYSYAALYWAQTLYQAPVPATILAALKSECQPSLLPYIHGLGALGLLQRTQQPPLITLKQRLLRGLVDRQEAARWAGSLGQKWRVWQTALAFHKTDTVTLLTGKRLKVET